MNIYASGMIGYETARKLYEENKALFETRFPKFFLKEFEKLSEESAEIKDFLDILCIEKNTKTSYSREKFYFDGNIYLREIKEGGIFAALWAACEDLEDLFSVQELRRTVGCEVRLEDIPLDQHVVEVTELLKESPYEVSSAGSYLVIPMNEQTQQNNPDNDESSDGTDGAYVKHGLTKIGEITEQKARVIINGEAPRFLTPPARQKQDIKDRNSYR